MKDNQSMGTPPCPQDQKLLVMHRLVYHYAYARGLRRQVAKIRLLDTGDGSKYPFRFSPDRPRSTARHLTSRHDLNSLNLVRGDRSS